MFLNFYETLKAWIHALPVNDQFPGVTDQVTTVLLFRYRQAANVQGSAVLVN